MDESTLTQTVSQAAAQALQSRLFDSLLPALELLTVELGVRGGLYRALDEHGDASPADLARAAGTAPRYAREWLEQQTAAGILEVAVDGEADGRRYRLPAGHAQALLDPESPYAIAGAPTFLVGIARAFEALVDDLTRGAGVPYSAYGREARHAISALNRPAFVHLMGEWTAQLPDLEQSLARGGTILDAGCGTGWSSVSLARAHPGARVVGVDLDPASIDEARANADAEGLAGRVEFAVADVGDARALRAATGVDVTLVTIFEALHDMLEPSRVLASVGSVLAPDGAVLVADEKVAESFTPSADPLERLNYAFSILHCLPATMAEGAGEANGTVLRPATLERWAAEAGLGPVRELPIENDLWRFSRIDRR